MTACGFVGGMADHGADVDCVSLTAFIRMLLYLC